MDIDNYEKSLLAKIEEIDAAIIAADEGNLRCVEQRDDLVKAINWLNELLDDYDNGKLGSNRIEFYNKIATNIKAIRMTKSYEANKDVNYDFGQIKDIVSYQSSYSFLKLLGFIQDNVVVVGANGSGKTTLAHYMKNTFKEILGIVIPAQKLLIVPTYDSIPTDTAKKYEEYQQQIFDCKQTYHTSKIDDAPYQEISKYGKEFNFVYGRLLSEMIETLWGLKKETKEKVIPAGEDMNKRLDGKLDRVIEIWNNLIEHRVMSYGEKMCLQIESKNENVYDASQTSDGERIILYLIGRVLLAPKNAIIIVDEPEIYLHKTIVDKLWNRLEAERRDCQFIYLTHDLDFAATREAIKVWIREFTYPSEWKLEKLVEGEIPQELLLRILGSRKKIMFCEGTKDSLDIKIFEMLFPNFTITPVASCSNVINYTKAFNRMGITTIKAVGVVDRDFRAVDEVKSREDDNIFTYDVAEIENLLLIEELLQEIKDLPFYSPNDDISKYKKGVLRRLDRDKQYQASAYVTSKINYIFSKEPIDKKRSIEDIEEFFANFLQQKVKLREWYNERMTEIKKIVDSGDYANAIKIYNNKGLFREVENWLRLGGYQKRALKYIESHDGIKDEMRKLFPQKLLAMHEC